VKDSAGLAVVFIARVKKARIHRPALTSAEGLQYGKWNLSSRRHVHRMASVHHVLIPHDHQAELARWSLNGRFDLREWDGEVVVRGEMSGATFIVSALAGSTLKALHRGAFYLDEVAALASSEVQNRSDMTASLAAAFALPGAPAREVLAVLRELEGLGLVRAELV
jgi:hypothetical protein